MSDVDQAIAEVASRQHGTFSVAQALQAGATRRMLRGRERAGITRSDVDVYRIAGLLRPGSPG